MRNLPYRIPMIILALIPFIFFSRFYEHFHYYMTGNIIMSVIKGQWHIVVLSIVVFLAFLIPLSYRRKAKWAEYGIVGAFFISLFVEMYGIPLTILFASKWFFTGEFRPTPLVEFDFLGVSFSMSHSMVYGTVLMILGAILIIVGWVTLYRAMKRQKGQVFVSSGIYKMSRHPQYLGFILIVIGWFFGWPTILTLIFTPILVYKYVRVCKKEETEFKGMKSYSAYQKKVPLLI